MGKVGEKRLGLAHRLFAVLSFCAIDPTLVSAQQPGASFLAECPSSLPQDVLNACDTLNVNAAAGKLSHNFSVPGTKTSIGISVDGTMSIVGAIYIISGAGVIASNIKYEFKIPFVSLGNIHSGNIGFQCNGLTKCISTSGAHIDGLRSVDFTSLDVSVDRQMEVSKALISVWKHFVPSQ